MSNVKRQMLYIFPLLRYVVQGDSMVPAFRRGNKIIVWRTKRINPGDVILFYKEGITILKRAMKETNGRWEVRGDNWNRSTDSADFGNVDSGAIVGKVIYSYD